MTVTIGKNGFSVTQGVVTVDKAFDNLKKIEGVLRDNIPPQDMSPQSKISCKLQKKIETF
jgi:hypothetical protein